MTVGAVRLTEQGRPHCVIVVPPGAIVRVHRRFSREFRVLNTGA